MNQIQSAENSSSSKALLIVVVLFIIIGSVMGGIFLLSNNADEDTSNESVASSDDESIDELMNNEENDQFDLPEQGEVKENDTETDSSPGSYVVYDQSLLQNAQDGNVVLFFHAPWCPTCKILNDNLEENRDSIPSDLTILKTDYDSQTELKKKYGITYQHTLVQVDVNGDQIKKWSGSYTLDEILAELNS